MIDRALKALLFPGAGRARTDPTAIRQRRLRLRISRSELVRRIGIDVTVLEHAERFGLEVYDRTVSAISDELGCPPGDLVTQPPNPSPSTNPDDALLLGALLADFRAPVHEQTIATTLGWAPGRRDAAETLLRDRLELLGQTVIRSPSGEITIAPSTACLSDQLRAALRHEALEFDHNCAQVLSLAINGRLVERLWDDLDDALHTAASELMAAGVVDEHCGRLVLSTALLNAVSTRHLSASWSRWWCHPCDRPVPSA